MIILATSDAIYYSIPGGDGSFSSRASHAAALDSGAFVYTATSADASGMVQNEVVAYPESPAEGQTAEVVFSITISNVGSDARNIVVYAQKGEMVETRLFRGSVAPGGSVHYESGRGWYMT